MRAETLRLRIRPFLHRHIDGLTNTPKPTDHIQIGKTQDLQTLAFQIAGPFSVFFLFLRVIVLGPVQFHRQFRLVTVKIYDVVPNDILPPETQRILAQESVPEERSLCRLIFAELLGKLF